MKQVRYPLLLGILLAAASSAYGDLRPDAPPSATSAENLAVAVRSVDLTPIQSQTDRRCLETESAGHFISDCLSTNRLGIAPLSSVPLNNDVGDEDIKNLPPLPGSASLFLSAVLSFGAWHVVRSAANLHLGDLPEWYHTGAPVQIGHTVVYDFCSDLPLCGLEQPLGEQPVFHSHWREHRSLCDSQSFLTCIDLRGPPILS